MVVLDAKGMLTAGSNQYLQPDYISPLTTTLDSKKSPLALLAQTCSQIGADSSKPIPSEKKKDEEKKEKSTPSPTETRNSPAFKPYETTKKSSEEVNGDDKSSGRSSGQNSQRPASVSSNGGGSSSNREDSGRRSNEATTSVSTNPIIRPGLEVLAGHPKDLPLGTYRTGVQPFLPPGYPGLDHPALRGASANLFAPGFISPNIASLASYPSAAAAAALYSTAGLVGAAGGLSSSFLCSPYISYTRVKTAGGGEAVVPVCRDPYCTGCAYSVQNNHLLQSGGACPPSCTQCEQAKAALSAIPGLNSVPSSSLVPASSLLPTTSTSLYSTPSPSILAGSPRSHVCNWTIGDSYCGKRFSTSEELLQHLRNHTSLSTDASALSLLSNPIHAHALLSSAHSALRSSASAYPPPALSPLAAARYHPYGKPHSSLTSTPALTPSLAGLSPYAPLAGATAAAYTAGFSPYAGLYPRPPL